MKLAIAQFDARMGDIQSICDRIEEQAMLVARRGARLLCVPAPLLAPPQPGSLSSSVNFQHDMLSALVALSERLEDSGVTCLVPAIVPFRESQLFDIMVLRHGHVVPSRSMLLRRDDSNPYENLHPPVFDIDGVRIALTFDAYRDIEAIPRGVDLVVFFQVDGFDASSSFNLGVASVAEGHYADLAKRSSSWFAYVAPIGGFDEAVYTGGSFLLDEDGRVVAAAPSFEEALLVEDVRRGMKLDLAIPESQLPAYHRETWLWEALRIHLKDTVQGRGIAKVMVHLVGDLQSSLLAALAVDALGSRNVVALHLCREDVVTPSEEAREERRSALVREIAARLGVRLVERSVSSGERVIDGDELMRDGMGSLEEGIEALCLEDTARAMAALPLSALTKTDYALAVGFGFARPGGQVAPFGDLYLTRLEHTARTRNRISAVLPESIVSLAAVEESMGRILGRALRGAYLDRSYAMRAREMLAGAGALELDAALEAAIDRDLPFEDIPLGKTHPAVLGVLLLLVGRGEGARRMLPSCPIVSARSFIERAWPVQLGWSDLGRGGAAPLSVSMLVEREQERLGRQGERQHDAMRQEVMGLIGGLLGLSEDQVHNMESEDTKKQLKRNFEQLMGKMREDGDGASIMAGGPFSLN